MALPVRSAAMSRNPTHLQRYAVAAGAVLLAFALRFGIYDALDNRIPFAFFTPATLVAAWYGGLGPGLFAALAGLLLGDYFFLPLHQSEVPLGEPERTAIGIYAMTNALIIVLFAHLHSRLRELEDRLRNRGGGTPKQRDAGSGGEVDDAETHLNPR